MSFGSTVVGEPQPRPGARSGARKRVAIVQSSYVPWKGYFDLMRRVDEFILLDDVQYTRRDWRNRNRVKTPQGLTWITIPVESKGNYRRAIRDIRVSDPTWSDRHWTTLRHTYSKAPSFAEYESRVEALYAGASQERLSEVNFHFLIALRDLLGITTPITWSMDYDAPGRQSEKLLGLCERTGATEYLSGPSAQAYLDEALFVERGIEVIWMDYSGYPEYEQLHPPFEHRVSALDLLFHTGSRAQEYMLPEPRR